MNLRQAKGSPIEPPSPDIIIFTNASKMGWGAVSHGVRANGKWSAQEKMLHKKGGSISAIEALLKNQRQITVRLNMDNSTAVS